MKKKTFFSVGTCAYNESKNIVKFINAVQNQQISNKFKLKEIIVIASGCTDNTIKLVKNLQKKDKKVRLIVQKEREGKAVAVNIFLSNAKSKILFLQSADTIPESMCYNFLLRELTKKDVGLAAGKIIPRDSENTFLGFINHLKWNLHHKINLKYRERPKVGELIAFKKIFERIPPETAVDEASIEPLVHLQGFKIVYVPKAIIYNQGPKTLKEYLSGRRRIYAGHFVTKKKYAYEIITFNPLRILPVFLGNLKLEPRFILYAGAAVFLEIIARTAGYLDVILNLRDHSIWKIAKTSKSVRL